MADPSTTEIVRLSARHHDPDRYLSALLAPAAARPHLLAMAAFGGEVAHVPLAVSEPMLGRIRLQWWREAVARACGETGEAAGHPVADALGQAVRSARLDATRLDAAIDAAEMLLERPALRDEPDLFAWLDGASGMLFESSARVLGIANSPALAAAARAAGRAHGLATLLAGIGGQIERGNLLLPATLLARHGLDRDGETDVEDRRAAALVELADLARDAHREACAAVGALPAMARPAFLPLATVQAQLGAIERAARGSWLGIRPISRLARIWRIGLVAAMGKFG